ncbi:hypothetical protein N2382_04920 [SAR92 clade bacterium H921]|nr:hypothetical protein [SAR92 clade bacterium H921]
MKTSRAVLTFLLLSSAMCLGKDDAITSSCQFYYEPDQLKEFAEAKNLLAKIGSPNAIKICEANEDKVFYVASEIKEEQGVSFFNLDRVFPVSLESEIRWDYLPPADKLHLSESSIYMLLSGSKDLVHSDDRFVQVKDMSIGVFKLLMINWHSYVSSEGELDNFFSGLSFFEKRSGSVASFKKALSGKDKPSIITAGMKVGKNKYPHYTFSAANENSMWIFDVDITEKKELKLIGLQVVGEDQ